MKWTDFKRGQTWEVAPGQFVSFHPDKARRIGSPNCPPEFVPRLVAGPGAPPRDVKPRENAADTRHHKILPGAAVVIIACMMTVIGGVA